MAKVSDPAKLKAVSVEAKKLVRDHQEDISRNHPVRVCASAFENYAWAVAELERLTAPEADQTVADVSAAKPVKT